MKKILILLALLTACGSSENGVVDANVAVDSAVVVDANVAADSAVVVDANVAADSAVADDAATSVDAGSDAATVADATVATDAAIDAGSVSPDAGMSESVGQCYLNSHCGAGSTCVATTPGGACSCDGSCDIGPENACFFATCTRDCETSDDCRPGMRCSSTSDTCALRTCSDDSACVAPYGCVSGFCRRRRCGDTECPSGTTCRETSDGLLCVEDFLTFD